MDYSVVDVDEVSTAENRPCTLRRLTEPAGLSSMAINRYSADPGEEIPLAYHYHDEQEEAFYVISGVLHVETPERTYEVAADELFAAEPKSPHRAFCPETAEEPVEVLAIGAPTVSDGDEVHAFDPETDELPVGQ
jgi:mannose-6-phosphate isomerase-like protein (cupin superfamily)